MDPNQKSEIEGILLVNKPKGQTSFTLVRSLRRILGVQKIGHAGTLDPFATGVMVMLIGRRFTQRSDTFLHHDKEYLANVRLGITTDTFDSDGVTQTQSDIIPTLDQIKEVLTHFNGHIKQVPPMYSAKKIGGKKLYELARKGQVIEREAVDVHVTTHLLSYQYPDVIVRVTCSKGTYVRSIADDMGRMLGCGAHLSALERIRSGFFRIEKCLNGVLLDAPETTAEFICSHLSKNENCA